MEKIQESAKAAIARLGMWFLKSFRGLICEQKNGGWELSKGAMMSWVAFYYIIDLVQAGKLEAVWLFYSWVGTMGYNGLKMTDVGGAITKLRGK